jgi:hypothetical protein
MVNEAVGRSGPAVVEDERAGCGHGEAENGDKGTREHDRTGICGRGILSANALDDRGFIPPHRDRTWCSASPSAALRMTDRSRTLRRSERHLQLVIVQHSAVALRSSDPTPLLQYARTPHAATRSVELVDSSLSAGGCTCASAHLYASIYADMRPRRAPGRRELAQAREILSWSESNIGHTRIKNEE